MRMRFSCLMLLSVAALALMLSPAQGDEAGDLYFHGYQAWKTGEKLEQAGKAGQARDKYVQAEEKIAAVQKRFPDWQREVVAYRLKNIRQRLAELVPVPPKQAIVPEPPASPARPYIPTIKPAPEFFRNPLVPFEFNGETYYKMLLSLESGRKSAPQR